MRIYKTLFFLVLLALTACNSNQPLPAGIIPPERMTPIIVDLHIIDGGLYNISQAPDSLYKFSMGNYGLVFKKYHTDSVKFRKSFKYYTTNPEQLDAIYADVVKILQAKNDSIAKIIVKPKTAPTTPKTNAVPAK